MSFYEREEMMELARNPKNKGVIQNASIKIKEINPLCGDEITIYANVESGKVSEISFDGKGCIISQVAASLLTEELKGKTLKEIEAMTMDDIGENLKHELTPSRTKCALLSLTAIKNGIKNFKESKK